MLSYILKLGRLSRHSSIRREKNRKSDYIKFRSGTVIADDLVIDGSLVSSGDVYLLGHVKGDVTCGNVFFGERGAVDGAVYVCGKADAANNEPVRA